MPDSRHAHQLGQSPKDTPGIRGEVGTTRSGQVEAVARTLEGTRAAFHRLNTPLPEATGDGEALLRRLLDRGHRVVIVDAGGNGQYVEIDGTAMTIREAGKFESGLVSMSEIASQGRLNRHRG